MFIIAAIESEARRSINWIHWCNWSKNKKGKCIDCILGFISCLLVSFVIFLSVIWTKHFNKLKFCCFQCYILLILFAGGTFELTSHSSKFTVIFSWGVIPVLWFNFTFNLYNWHAIMLRNSHFFYVWLLYDLCICVVFFLPSSHHFGFLIFEKYIALNNTCCVYFSILCSSNLISLHTGQILLLWQSPRQILLARVWQLSLWYYLLLIFAHLF